MKPGIHATSGSWPTGPSVGARVEPNYFSQARSAASLSPAKNGRSRSMAERYAAIRVTRRFSAPPECVFDAWLDPEVAGKWLFATASRPMVRVAIDARVEGSFCFVDRQYGKDLEYTGEYLEISPPRRLVFTLAAEHQPQVLTRVRVEIAPRATGCTLTLTHENVAADYASRTEARWTGMLYGLGETLDASSGRGEPG